MSKNVIFCYSGSGNCLDIAKNIAKKLGDTDIVLMRMCRRQRRWASSSPATPAVCPGMWRNM